MNICVKRIIATLLYTLMLVMTSSASFAKSAPNFLLIIADDLGLDSLSIYGLSRKNAQTPNLARLAQSGIIFSGFWATPAWRRPIGRLQRFHQKMSRSRCFSFPHHYASKMDSLLET